MVGRGLGSEPILSVAAVALEECTKNYVVHVNLWMRIFIPAVGKGRPAG